MSIASQWLYRDIMDTDLCDRCKDKFSSCRHHYRHIMVLLNIRI